jgi:hypothetical protein
VLRHRRSPQLLRSVNMRGRPIKELNSCPLFGNTCRMMVTRLETAATLLTHNGLRPRPDPALHKF